MFSHEGPSRSLRKNVLLAGILAGVAGYVNSGGFFVVGLFTSHVTGSVGRVGSDVAVGAFGAAALAAVLVVSFFVGAFVATWLLEGTVARGVPQAYGRALVVESVVLAAFVVVANLAQATDPRALDAEAALLCLAMGLQNSLVTRLSGATVRTTHLTGVVTDLGIESARWSRWLVSRGEGPERPQPQRALLLLTVVAAFGGGAVLGGVLTSRVSHWAMALPALVVGAIGVQAWRSKRAAG